MIKLLLMDDEYFFRESLKKSVEWELLGIEICAEADNGEKALSMLKKYTPDIILADINMPKMDGLTFIQKAKEIRNDIKIIIISGYDRFDYAKRAIHMGVKGYLLKPVDEKELMGLLKAAVDEIQQEKIITYEQKQFRQKFDKSQYVAKQYCLKELLLLNEDKEVSEIEENIKEVLAGWNSFTVIVGKVEQGEDLALLNFIASNILGEKLGKSCRFENLQDDRKNIVFLVNQMDAIERDAFCGILEDCQKIFSDRLDRKVLFGIGNTYHSYENIYRSYQEAIKVLPFDISQMEKPVINYQDADNVGQSGPSLSAQQKIQITMRLNENDFESLREMTGDIFKELEGRCLTEDAVRIFSIELLLLCMNKIHTGDKKQTGGIRREQLFDRLDKINSYSELKGYILEVYQAACSEGNQQGGIKPERTPERIREVVSFIEGHYQEEKLSVESIAKEFYINYNYLCVLFKKHMDITINDFITETRMQKALEMMYNGAFVVQEIAEKVGYTNVNYFSKCFKKKFGVPPSQYISSIRD